MSKHSSGIKISRVSLGVASAILVVAVLAALSILSTGAAPWNGAMKAAAGISQQVSPKQLEQYCPSQMNLADTHSYGDSEFQATTGDITSRTRYVAMGSIFHAQVSDIADAQAENATVLGNTDQNSTDVITASAQSQKNATLFDTRILTTQDGTGAAGALMSWATRGDIVGVSSTSCIATGKRQQLLVPATTSGNTQQLVIANPSDRSISVSMEMWGTTGGPIAMATNSVISIGANKTAYVNLAAAAPKQEALYVSVTSSTSPIATVVRSISMDGLTPHGSDFVVPQHAMACHSVIPMDAHDADSAHIMLFGHADSDVRLKWITKNGAKDAAKQHLDADKVQVVDLHHAPQHTVGVAIESNEPVAATGRMVQNGKDGQQDFACMNAATGFTQAAVAIPEEAGGSVELSNPANRKVKATVEGIGVDGMVASTEHVTLNASGGTSIDLDDLGDNLIAVHVYGDDPVAWGVVMNSKAVDEAQYAGIGYLQATDFNIAKQTVTAHSDLNLVR